MTFAQTSTPCSTALFVAGFEDQFPSARNGYTLGLGATIFRTEAETTAFVEDKVISWTKIGPFTAEVANRIIERHKHWRKRHAASCGMDGKDEWAETYE